MIKSLKSATNTPHFFKTETDSEYETVDGYVVEFNCPPDAEFEISELEYVSVI